jgi:hypothetical protein
MATTFKVNSFNINGVRAAVDIAQSDMAQVVDRQLSMAISSDIWQWPRPTKRRNGKTVKIVTSPRNIVNKADLLNSQKMTKNGRRGVIYSWSVGYALLVHFGYSKKGTVVPGRPWTKLGLAKSNAQGVFVDSFRRNYR